MSRANRDLSPVALTLLAIPLALIVAVADGQGFLDYFTGDVEVVDSSEMRSSRIRFSAGARTNWHTHSEPQLLLIEQGQGRVQEMGGPIHVLRQGESFYTQPALRHWHGADPNQAAVQFSVYAGELEWMEGVSDDDYLGR